jgi:succinate dehydrogenase/fumarate reductase cytochrome b subunit
MITPFLFVLPCVFHTKYGMKKTDTDVLKQFENKETVKERKQVSVRFQVSVCIQFEASGSAVFK